MTKLFTLCMIGAFAACSNHGASQSVPDAAQRSQGQGVAGGCIIASDCNSPLTCAFRRCHVACTSTRDCEPGQRCMASDRPFHICQLAQERACSLNSDCPPGQLCGADMQCRDQCTSARDCLLEQACVGGTCAENAELFNGRLVPIVDAEPPTRALPCRFTSECPEPLICRNDICAIECLMRADCNVGSNCLNNRCVIAGGGGADGGGSDSGR